MNADGLTLDEILHYGRDGVVEGLSPEVATRIDELLVENDEQAEQENTDAENDMNELVSELRNLVSEYG